MYCSLKIASKTVFQFEILNLSVLFLTSHTLDPVMVVGLYVLSVMSPMAACWSRDRPWLICPPCRTVQAVFLLLQLLRRCIADNGFSQCQPICCLQCQVQALNRQSSRISGQVDLTSQRPSLLLNSGINQTLTIANICADTIETDWALVLFCWHYRLSGERSCSGVTRGCLGLVLPCCHYIHGTGPALLSLSSAWGLFLLCCH